MEKIALHLEHGKRRHRAWATGIQASWQYCEVSVGQLADGRWWVAQAGRIGSDAWTVRDEAEAQRTAEGWMAGHTGEWREIPPAFDGFGRPIDDREWVARGQRWVLVDPPGR